MTKFGRELLQASKEALAVAEGKLQAARVIVFPVAERTTLLDQQKHPSASIELNARMPIDD